MRFELSGEELHRIQELAVQEQSEEPADADDSDEEDAAMATATMEDGDEEFMVRVKATKFGVCITLNFQIMEQGDKAIAMDHQSDDEDADDEEIRPTDILIAVAMSEDEHSHLEIQLLTDDGDLYTHHDIALPDFPLCLAWLDCPPYLSEGQQQSTGNYMGN